MSNSGDYIVNTFVMAGFVGLESVGAHVDRLDIFIVKSLDMKAA